MDGAICGLRWEALRSSAENRATHAWFVDSLHLIVQDDVMCSPEVHCPDQVPLAEYYLARLGKSRDAHTAASIQDGAR